MPPDRLLAPEAVLRLSPEGADELLDRLEREVPVHPSLVEVPAARATEAIVVGDTHGDWRSARAALDRWSPGPPGQLFVGLGDYVDRAPADCGEGSVANALMLLELAGRYPDRVFLVQGNHETDRRIPVLPHDLPEEVDQLWGPEQERYTRLAALLERGPLAVASANGVYFAHAGFPKGPYPSRWTDAFEPVDDERLAEIVWSGCDASAMRRGADPRFGAGELQRFFAASGLRRFLRGHDPDLTGRWVYGGLCLTLQTTRHFERFGGVILARVALDRPADAADAIVVEHLPTEGRRFDAP